MDEVCSLCCGEDGKLFDNCPNPTHFKDFYNSLQQPQTHFVESFNENPNLGYTPQEPFVYNQDPNENFSQSPPQIDQRYCYGCGDPLDDLFCQRCTCVLCGNDAHYGYDCPPQVPFVYDQDLCFNQNFDNNFPQTSPSFPQQFPCCENYGGPHGNFQCQPMNQNFYEPNLCYNSISSGFDQNQPSQLSVIHQPPQEISIQDMKDLKQQYLDEMKSLINEIQIKDYCNKKIDIEIKINELKENFNGMSIELNKKKKHQQLEQVANLSTYPSQHFYSFYYDDDDDYDYQEKLDKEYVSSVKDLNLTPSESEDLSDDLFEDLSDIESECDVPVCDDFMTYPNPLFDSYNDSTSSDDESFSDEDILKENFKICLNPFFYEEIISTKIDPHHFNAEFYLIESLLNRDTLIVSSPKFDSLLEEFSSELAHINLISPEIDEVDFDPEEEIHLVEKLLYDNSSPRPLEEFIFENSDAGDVLFLEELLNDDSISLYENESFHFNHYYDPSSPRPPTKPSDDDGIHFDAEPDTGILTVKVVDDNS
uniref:Uncharacterized protein n=1 Tax=Tanacetum cinerariifolium TaxID=118510 RepID=A0A6L2M1Z5_TANCI|nr:hypothetical protein [Tanacetum cinerariifolium]